MLLRVLLAGVLALPYQPLAAQRPAVIRKHQVGPVSIGTSWKAQPSNRESNMARVTGIGGVFLKSKRDGASLAAWYREHLGMQLEPFGGAILRWPDDTADDRGLTVWHTADSDSQWFSPSTSSFMINYRVDNLDQLLEQLRASGVVVIQGPESHENGKFAWIMDPDDNKVELWEPKAWDAGNLPPQPSAHPE